MRFHRLRADLKAAVAISMGLASFLALGPAVAGDVKAGRAKADVCATCHGLDGLSKIAEAPNLAGQSEGYLIAQLNAFRSGARVNEMMSIVIKDLTDADIENLAAYYSAIPITVGKPPGE